MRIGRWLLAIWLCFLVRGFFYCAALPLWEGFDEWSHFGVVERMAFHGEALVSREDPLPRDVAASLELVPLPWELRGYHPPSATHDVFWKLPPAERARREAEFRAIPPAWALQESPVFKTYEGLQGPLSGWLMAPVLWTAHGLHLAAQVLLLRVFGVMLVSLTIPLTFLTCRTVFGDPRLALGCSAAAAAMPGLLIDTAHVSNEATAVTLFTALIWLSVEVVARGLTGLRAAVLGVVLGLGLLAKAYFLAALPPLALLLVWKFRRDRRALLIPALGFAISGWWYVRNLLTTSSISGMWETANLPHATLADQIREATRIHWGVVVDSILFSHLWLGSWSTLTVRSWMYHALYVVCGLAAAGLVWDTLRPAPTSRLRTARAGLTVLALYFLFFWIGQLYHSVTLFMVWGIATTLGGYLCAITTAETALCVAGLRALVPRRIAPLAAAFGAGLFALLDLYSMNLVALPYYAGYTAHRPNGFLATFHPEEVNLSQFTGRIAAFKPAWLPETAVAALWIAYVAATFALPVLAFRTRERVNPK